MISGTWAVASYDSCSTVSFSRVVPLHIESHRNLYAAQFLSKSCHTSGCARREIRSSVSRADGFVLGSWCKPVLFVIAGNLPTPGCTSGLFKFDPCCQHCLFAVAYSLPLQHVDMKHRCPPAV